MTAFLVGQLAGALRESLVPLREACACGAEEACPACSAVAGVEDALTRHVRYTQNGEVLADLLHSVLLGVRQVLAAHGESAEVVDLRAVVEEAHFAWLAWWDQRQDALANTPRTAPLTPGVPEVAARLSSVALTLLRATSLVEGKDISFMIEDAVRELDACERQLLED